MCKIVTLIRSRGFNIASPYMDCATHLLLLIGLLTDNLSLSKNHFMLRDYGRITVLHSIVHRDDYISAVEWRTYFTHRLSEKWPSHVVKTIVLLFDTLFEQPVWTISVAKYGKARSQTEI